MFLIVILRVIRIFRIRIKIGLCIFYDLCNIHQQRFCLKSQTQMAPLSPTEERVLKDSHSRSLPGTIFSDRWHTRYWEQTLEYRRCRICRDNEKRKVNQAMCSRCNVPSAVALCGGTRGLSHWLPSSFRSLNVFFSLCMVISFLFL